MTGLAPATEPIPVTADKRTVLASRLLAPTLDERLIEPDERRSITPLRNCASKFAVDALSQAMRIDLLKKKIRVTVIHPGAAETEFSLVRLKGDAEKAKNVYKGFTPLSANDIADVISYCYSTPVHVNINEMVIVPTAQANPYYINRE